MNEKVAKALSYVDEKYVSAAAKKKKKKARRLRMPKRKKKHILASTAK